MNRLACLVQQNVTTWNFFGQKLLWHQFHQNALETRSLAFCIAIIQAGRRILEDELRTPRRGLAVAPTLKERQFQPQDLEEITLLACHMHPPSELVASLFQNRLDGCEPHHQAG